MKAGSTISKEQRLRLYNLRENYSKVDRVFKSLNRQLETEEQRIQKTKEILNEYSIQEILTYIAEQSNFIIDFQKNCFYKIYSNKELDINEPLEKQMAFKPLGFTTEKDIIIVYFKLQDILYKYDLSGYQNQDTIIFKKYLIAEENCLKYGINEAKKEESEIEEQISFLADYLEELVLVINEKEEFKRKHTDLIQKDLDYKNIDFKAIAKELFYNF
ncbi:hypothetical protein MMMIC1C10_11190 [Methanococcus maripaludis]|uniref:hypothetical protein n=1 Tax=Methanococcus maripaludis TaxID=39152 RepID=UPI003141B99B